MPIRIELLFKKFTAGSCSREEFNELMDYLQQRQHEQQVRVMLQQVYDTLGGKPAKPAVYRKMLVAAAAAAVLAGAVFIGYRLWQPKAVTPASMAAVPRKTATQNAEQKYLLLPDSTQVWVNAASTLEFPHQFDKSKREVFLNGEAYFDVRNADKIPFIIHTPNGIVTRVLGTAFNIKAYPYQRNVIVAVKRGKVQVAREEEVVAVLTAGQKIQVNIAAATQPVQPVKQDDVAEWTQGRLAWDSVPLDLIVKDIERTYNVQIDLKNEKIKNTAITTSFRKDIGPKEALELVCLPVEARLITAGGRYIIE